jgi:hypothetical protein
VSDSIPIESTDSGRLSFVTSADGTRQVRFKMGASIFTAGILGVWLCGWAVGEIAAVTVLLPNATTSSEGMGFILIWLVLWTIGGAAAGGTLLWMLFGEEDLELPPGKLLHAYRVFGLTRVRAFDAREISNLQFHEQRMRRSTQTALSFDYGTRSLRIFHAINSAEAERAIAALEPALGIRRET